jgi:hypothetical protein
MTKILSFLFALIFLTSIVFADARILPMRERAAVIDRWLTARVQTVLPELMRRGGIDMWIIISREYNEDPVIRTFLPSDWQSARRRTILLVYDAGGDHPLETLAVARYAVGEMFEQAWDRERDGEQWTRLAALIDERNPRRIGLNFSETFALADGITRTEYELFHQALPPRLHERVVSAENLAIGWLETRTADEMSVYQQIVRIAHEILAEGLSEQAIQPGITTTNDVSWWYRDRIRELRLTTWFHPSVSIQRAEQPAIDMKAEIASRHDDEVIMPGDLLHVDFGITYLRLNTDTQQHAYVLRPGESEAPEELRHALVRGNRLQDILTDQFVTGRTGNEILASALAVAKDEGITASIYTHPIGFHGHAAGPTIGLWDQQEGVPGRGDYPLYPNTAHSIELYAETAIESWDKPVRIKLEEDAFFDGGHTYYIDGRQRELLLIPRVAPVQ